MLPVFKDKKQKILLEAEECRVGIKMVTGIDNVKEDNGKILAIIEDKEFFLEDDINMASSLLYPLKLKHINVLPNIHAIPRTDIDETHIKHLVKIHLHITSEDANYNNSFEKSQSMMIEQLSGQWSVFYKKLNGLAIKNGSRDLFAIKLNNKDFIASNINGKVKDIRNEEVYHFVDFLKKYLGVANRDIWNTITQLVRVPLHRQRDIIIQNNSYFYNDGKSMVQLTNWTGSIIRSFEDSAQRRCWLMDINNEEVFLHPDAVISSRAFQRMIARRGMFFFYGNDTHLKKLMAFLYSRFMRS